MSWAKDIKGKTFFASYIEYKPRITSLPFTNLRFLQDFEAAVAKQIAAENERDAANEELQFTTETLNLVCLKIAHPEMRASFPKKTYTCALALLW